MRVVVAPDSFKSVLNATDVAHAIAQGVRRARPDAELDIVPMADGGEGTLDCLLAATPGNRRRVHAHDPIGRPVDAPVALINDATTAVIELANVAGFSLLPPDRRDPLTTTTHGLGEVLRAACETEIERIILAAGGSATVDGGAGMMQALGLSLIDRNGIPLEPGIGGGRLADIKTIIWKDPPPNLHDIHWTVACDVLNPACGPAGAAPVFAPQKGAAPQDVLRLADGLENWADVLQHSCGTDIRNEPGTGAAGGVPLPLLALLGATLVPGVDLLFEAHRLPSRIALADLVITGEGRLDAQSMMGKVVGAVGRLARTAAVPCIAIVGTTGPGADRCADLLDQVITLDAPPADTATRLTDLAENAAQHYL